MRPDIGGIPRKEKERAEGNDDRAASLDDRTAIIGSTSGDIMVLGTVKGLVSEGDLVLKAFKNLEPDVVGLHIGIEEVKGLKAVVKGNVENTYLSSYEKVYARELSRFGEVQIPPPSLVKAYKLAKKHKVPVKALDFNESNYSNIYTDLIDGMTMIRQSMRLKKVNRRKFKADSPEDFILEWDGAVNKFKGFRKLEGRREEKMARRIRELSKEFGKVLAVVEYERMEGIVHHLTDDGK